MNEFQDDDDTPCRTILASREVCGKLRDDDIHQMDADGVHWYDMYGHDFDEGVKR